MALSTKIVGVAAIAALAAAGYYALTMPAPATPVPTTIVRVGAAVVAAEVASTPAAQVQGLSGRAGLAEGTGLLFDFGGLGDRRMWMKDMRFAIDIVWANDAVVAVAHGVAPNTYPQSFGAPVPTRYVLELPAGYAAAHGIAEGVQFVVQ